MANNISYSFYQVTLFLTGTNGFFLFLLSFPLDFSFTLNVVFLFLFNFALSLNLSNKKEEEKKKKSFWRLNDEIASRFGPVWLHLSGFRGLFPFFFYFFFVVLVYSSSSVLSSNGHRQEWIYCLALAESYTITIAIWCYIFQVLCLRFVFFFVRFSSNSRIKLWKREQFFYFSGCRHHWWPIHI